MTDLLRIWFAHMVLKLLVTVYPKRGTSETALAVQSLSDSMRKDAIRAHNKASVGYRS
jgi:hypothetical protein